MVAYDSRVSASDTEIDVRTDISFVIFEHDGTDGNAAKPALDVTAH